MVETMNGLVCILCSLGIVLFASIWFFIKATLEINQLKKEYREKRGKELNVEEILNGRY